MFTVLTQMAALIVCGIGWRALRPLGLDADPMRHALTSLVYVLLLPALVLKVLWVAPLSGESVRIAILAATGVLLGLASAWIWFRLGRAPQATVGAMILAAGFPNVTYLGLPVLQQSLGDWASRVAIQYDLFACTPLLLSLGIAIARHHGHHEERTSPLRALLKVPPLWAAVVAVALNGLHVPLPPALHGLLEMLGHGVIPLMLIALGMGLRWDTWHSGMLLHLLPVLLIQLLLTPAAIWMLSGFMALDGDLRRAVVLEAAMPTMVLGIVLTDRYGLDSGLYAAAVTLSTALSMLTLPLWFGWLG